ncbi:MAG: outer membrane protein assembly factor BamB [Zoogloeaceae bacterium]|jgi:outer membrane protein assembly factor BamB|nr:outer membrane protein assembly factor BamB [Zoogloeaceae bacterium]
MSRNLSRNQGLGKKRLARFLAAALVVCGLAACSSLGDLGIGSLGSLNPFASKAPRMTRLEAIQPLVTLRPSWSYSIGKAGTAIFSPAIVGNAVFVAAADGSVARLEDGVAVWRIQAGRPLSAGVGSDGELVAVGTAEGEILVFSARDGAPLWQARASSEILSPPLVEEGLVIVRSGDHRIIAFDAEGKRKWLYQRPVPSLFLRSAAPLRMADQFVLAGFPGGKLVAISVLNGAPVWEGNVALPKGATELDRIADVVSPPALLGPVGCAVAFQGKLTCFDFSQNGSTLWSKEVSSSAGLAIDPESIYVTDGSSAVLAFALATGGSRWKQDRLLHRKLTAPLAVGRDHLAVGDAEGILHLLSRQTGTLVGRQSTDGTPVLALSLDADGRILAQTQGGRVFLFTLE